MAYRDSKGEIVPYKMFEMTQQIIELQMPEWSWTLQTLSILMLGRQNLKERDILARGSAPEFQLQGVRCMRYGEEQSYTGPECNL